MEQQIKELEATKERLLLELGYLQSKSMQVDALEAKIVKLEEELASCQRSERRAWELWREMREEQKTIRNAAMEAIRQLQVELERVKTQA